MSLHDIQTAVRAPKGLKNDFGGYSYRNAEQIIAAVKRVMPEGAYLTLSDDLLEVGGALFVRATACLHVGGQEHTATGWAMHALAKKGMDPAQITGAASSYARKYALQGLLALDDSRDDPDAGAAYDPGPDPLLAEIAAAQTATDMNRLGPRARGGSAEVQKAYVARVKGMGLARNPSGPGYIDPPQKAEPVDDEFGAPF
jgi:hypothetical protein